MANNTKAENAAALKAAGIPQRSFSIPIFCARHDISPGHYANLRKHKMGPKETDLLGRKVITDRDEEEWLRERAAASATAEGGEAA